MFRNRILQLGPTTFATVALAVVFLWVTLTEMPDKTQAPLYALAAATGLVMALVPRPKHDRDTLLRLAIQGATAISAAFSAYNWLQSVQAGTATGVVAGVWVISVALFVSWHVYEQQPKDDPHVEEVEAVD